MSKQSDLISVSQGAAGDPLFIDTVNDRVGVGTSSPDRKLTLSVSPGSATDDGVKVVEGSNTAVLARTGSAYSYRGVGASSTLLYSNNTLSFLADGSSNMTFHNGGNERMRIDTAGRVTMPYQPAMHGRLTNSTTFNGGDTFKPDILNVNIGNHYSSATGLFTAPVGGVYQISGTFLVQAVSSSGTALAVFPYYNGVVASSYGSIYASSFSTEISVAGVFLVPLSANDTLGLALTSGGTIRLYGAENFMSIRFLG